MKMAPKALKPSYSFIFVIVISVLLFSLNSSQATNPSLDEIRKYLEKLNKPSLKTIKSADGDIIDCVDIHRQPAFDSPEMKNHTIQVTPHPNDKKNSSFTRGAWQTWHLTGEQCPNGTIPIRRKSVSDVLRFGSLADFGKKKYSQEKPDSSVLNGHEHAVALTSQGSYWGTSATFNLWNPYVQSTDSFSLSQLWLMAGSYSANDLNTIEVGWQVYPQLWNGNLPRLFIYWTRDAYTNTGCYNLFCSGFVQVNNGVLLGGSISPLSIYNGNQYEVTILVWKDPNTKNWWLQFQGINVGYWPANIFTRLQDHANVVEWGGEIYTPIRSGPHTTTQMGSGHFAEEGWTKACYIKKLLVVNGNNQYASVGTLSTIATRPGCYDINVVYGDANWGDYIFFGGPGMNPNCPTA